MAAVQQNLPLQKATRTARNYGIDALRLVSMLFVVLLHIVDSGGLISEGKGAYLSVALLIEVATYCAVDCYALISGYVGYTDTPKPFRSYRIISLWVQVVFYCVGISFICLFFFPQVGVTAKDIFRYLFPVTGRNYWFVAAYAALYFFIPFLNKLIRRLSKTELTKLVTVIFCLFCLTSLISKQFGADPFDLHKGGYSVLWLISLYIVGGWLKKCDIPQRVNGLAALAAIVVLTVGTWIVETVLPTPVFKGALIKYVSPTVVLIAVGYVIIFSKFRPSKISTKIIAFLSPSAFGVYILHVQRFVWDFCIEDKYIPLLEKPIWSFPLWILLSALCVFAAGLLIETVRRYLFRWCGIDFLCKKLAALIDRLLRRVSHTTERYFEE